MRVSISQYGMHDISLNGLAIAKGEMVLTLAQLSQNPASSLPASEFSERVVRIAGLLMKHMAHPHQIGSTPSGITGFIEFDQTMRVLPLSGQPSDEAGEEHWICVADNRTHLASLRGE